MTGGITAIVFGLGLFTCLVVSGLACEIDVIIFLMVFCGIFVYSGAQGVYKVVYPKIKEKEILSKGNFLGTYTIVEYFDNTTGSERGYPLLGIRCLNPDNGIAYRFYTDTSDERKFPIRATVDIYAHGGYVTYDRKSVSMNVNTY